MGRLHPARVRGAPPVALEQCYQVPLTGEVRASGAVLAGAVGLISDPAYAESLLVEGRADAELGLDWREIPYPPQYTRGKWG